MSETHQDSKTAESLENQEGNKKPEGGSADEGNNNVTPNSSNATPSNKSPEELKEERRKIAREKLIDSQVSKLLSVSNDEEEKEILSKFPELEDITRERYNREISKYSTKEQSKLEKRLEALESKYYGQITAKEEEHAQTVFNEQLDKYGISVDEFSQHKENFDSHLDKLSKAGYSKAEAISLIFPSLVKEKESKPSSFGTLSANSTPSVKEGKEQVKAKTTADENFLSYLNAQGIKL